MLEVSTQTALEQPRKSTRLFDHTYTYLFAVIAVLIIVSPLTRFVNVRNFDRIMDAITILLIVVRMLEIAKYGGKITAVDFTFWAGYIFIIFWNVIGSIFAYNFHIQLFLLEIKACVFLLAVLLFRDRKLPRMEAARITRWLFIAFVVASSIFLLVGRGRLVLLNESNYTIIALLLTTHSMIATNRVVFFGRKWVAVQALVVAIIVLSQSRTGMASYGVYLAIEIVRHRSVKAAIFMAFLVSLATMAIPDILLDSISRGMADDIESIDRFVFLKEYSYHLSQNPGILAFNFAFSSFFSDQTVYMGWWVAKQAQEHGLPYGLAAYNFHSEYLRMIAVYGLPAAAAIFAYTLIGLSRGANIVTALIIMVAATSMSVLHLSSVLPFAILAMLTARSEHRSFVA